MAEKSLETVYQETLQELGDNSRYNALRKDDENFILTAGDDALYMCLPKKRSGDMRIQLHLGLPCNASEGTLDSFLGEVRSLKDKVALLAEKGIEGDYSPYEGCPCFYYSIPFKGKQDVQRILHAFNI